jgi:acyl carrier protein
MKTIFDRVKHVIAGVLAVTEKSIVPEASLVEDLGADSLDLVNLTFALEEEFSDANQTLKFPEEAMEEIQTVQQIIAFLTGAGIAE